MLHAGDFVASCGIPDADGAVPATRDHPLPIRTEDHGFDTTIMLHVGDFVAACGFPDADGAVSAAGDYSLPIQAEGHGSDRILMLHAGDFRGKNVQCVFQRQNTGYFRICLQGFNRQ